MSSTYKLTLEAPERHAAVIAAVIAEAGGEDTAVSLDEVAADLWRVEAYFAAYPDLEALRQALITALGERMALPGLMLERLAEEDWVAHSQRDLRPVRAGRFVVHGSHDRARTGGRRHAIEIDAGQAFGTAHHGTTQGCLLALERLVRRRPVASALDLGTGSGVLAIALAKAGRCRVLATDIDAKAVAVARDNCRRNGVAACIAMVQASGFDHPALRLGRFDAITANILAAPLLSLAAPMRDRLKPGGTAILSGLLDSQAQEVIGRYCAMGFRLERRLSRNGWTTLMMTRC